MNRFTWPIFLLLGALASAQDGNPPSPPAANPGAVQVAPTAVAPASDAAVTVTESQQFMIRGGDVLVRSALATQADGLRKDLLRLTGGKDAKGPLVFVILHGKEGDKMKPRSVAVRQLVRDAGFDLEIHVHLSHGVDTEAFDHAVFTALVCCRAAQASAPPNGETPLVVPPWLVEGLKETVAWRANRSDRKLYEALHRHGGLYTPNELFSLDDNAYADMDGAMRAAFRGSAGALVMAMVEQAQGQEGMAAFLTEVAMHQGEMSALLRRHFPGMNLSDASLPKWLALKLADLASPTVTEALSIGETDAALTLGLMLNFRNEAGELQTVPVDQWQDVADLSATERAGAVRQAQDALVRLSYRCFPPYRPLLLEYQTVLSNIARGKTRKTAATLEALAKTRSDMVARGERAADVLDWLEINGAKETSGAFEDYRRLKARLMDNPTSRNDPLTVYLERLDRLFFRAEARPTGMPAGMPPPPGIAGGDAGSLPDLPGNLPQYLPMDDQPLQVPPLPSVVEIPK